MSHHVVFCLDNSGVGGTELNAVRTAERLTASGYSVEVACLGRHQDLIRRYRQAGVEVKIFPVNSLASASAVYQGLRLWKYLRDRDPEIFHAHDTYGNIFGVPCARLAGIPVVLASRRWWSLEVRPGHDAANRFAYRLADAIIVNSPSVAELTRGVAGKNSSIAVVPNYVDEVAFEPPQRSSLSSYFDQLEVPDTRSVVGCIAGLRREKGHNVLISAVSRLTEVGYDVHLVLVGDGPERPALCRQVEDLDLQGRVSFVGHQPHTPNLHHLFDVSVLASTNEAFPNSLLEAMAASRPVVATAVGGIPDAVEDGRTGILVPPDDPSSFARAIGRLVSDPDLAESMGRAGRERIRANFTPASSLTALTGVYAELLN